MKLKNCTKKGPGRVHPAPASLKSDRLIARKLWMLRYSSNFHERILSNGRKISNLDLRAFGRRPR